jgi:Ca2+-binding RTX toxin-like protein
MAIKHGTAGADTITGTSLADQLFGEGGNDVLKGLAGPDTLDGGEGRDAVTYAGSAASVNVLLGSSFGGGGGGGGDAAGDTYVGIENVVGSSFDDDLFGDGAGNRLDGGRGGDDIFGDAGNDTVVGGGGGNDTLQGGAGADVLSGGGGRDTLTYRASVLGVNVDLSKGQVSGGDAGGDTVSGFEDLVGSGDRDVLAGTLGANSIQGGNAADRLFGFAGNDTLQGGGGADTMTGGDGADRFSYDGTGDQQSPAGFFARDVILDFRHDQGDRIDLFQVDAAPSNPAIDAFEFLGRGPTIDAPGQIEYVFEGGNTVVRINTAGDLAPEMEIQLLGNIDLVAGDFIL